MDLNPLSFVILLNLNRKFLEPFKIFDLSYVSFELFLTAIVENACNDSFEDLGQLIPKHAHDNEHYKIEQSQLKDNEKQVKDQ